MIGWNVVLTIREDRFRQARRLLGKFGKVETTDYYNVVTLQVGDVRAFLESMREALDAEPHVADCFGRVVPVTTTFGFRSADSFEAGAREAVAPFASALAGKRFHVRMHRRGFHDVLSSQEEERQLDGYLLQRLEHEGQSASIDFEDPDAIVTVETVGGRAGVALWERCDLERYPFLHLD
jgi:tRNA(Ser,Leu) C12 N-acetylase TAN1